MGRRKVNLELIRNESVRKTTFRKRKAGLIKKVKELTTLCGVQGCAVIYNRHGGDPQIWPSAAEATAVLRRFQDLPPEKQTKHMKNQDGSELTRRMVRRRMNCRSPAAEAEAEVDLEAELEALLTAVVDDREYEERLFGKMGVEEMKELSGFLEGRITAIGGEIDGLRAAAEGGDDVSSESDEDDEDYDEEDDSMSSD